MGILDYLFDRRQKGFVIVKEGNLYRERPARLHTTVNTKRNPDGTENDVFVTQWDYTINGVRTTVIQPEQIDGVEIMPEYKELPNNIRARVVFVKNGRLIASPGAGEDQYNISASRVAYLTRSTFLADLGKTFRVQADNAKNLIVIAGVVILGLIIYFMMSGGGVGGGEVEATTTATTTQSTAIVENVMVDYGNEI